MKNIVKIIAFVFTLVMTANVYGSVVNINNPSLFKVRADLDIIAYPDPQREIGSNTSITENIGAFFMRGIKIGVHIGDQFIENILSESHSQTLGLGDINYYILSGVKNLGREKFLDEYVREFSLYYVLEFTFYLIRCPRFLYSGGIVCTSKPVRVRTRDFETYRLVEKDTQQALMGAPAVCYNQAPTCIPVVAYNQAPVVNYGQAPTNAPSVMYGGTVVR
jgi:hypothetical protein